MTFFKTIKYCLTIVFMVTLVSICDRVYADGMGYSVQAVIPENQIDQSKTYFDLKMNPGQTQNIELEIKSSSEETLNLAVVPYIGTTNQNGELEYSVEPEKNDSTLVYPITRLISGQQKVTLKPKETKRVTFTLKMPKKAFEGKIVGGFNVYDEANDATNESKSKKNDVQIKNVFSVVIGIQLRENLDKIKPELKLNTVKASLFNYRTAIIANLQNTQPEFISELSVSTKVRKQNSKKVIYEAEKSDMAMAPNSNFNFPISLENQEIEAGNYELELIAHSKTENWRFTKKFRITEDEAVQLNTEAVEIETETGNMFIWIIVLSISLVMLLLLVIIFLVWRRRK
ncbi:DUF916 and DUF3324 domain-containing protein [Candidatus Enterococcus ikei]|uniref:DUF916 and DUF3324 domain-containing protein n=1 Tax=Candidatus Enterococcus ikei TaxID=2815326 RepID=A0ABS3H211_9ENTE|nr:DUF916 and DUF3324 domain-containing protein [Enterococcus sp. DIV0869a]MBO0441571.1 DUF916 and DUF3324 domain-containing protein [Enterococcus sp. DIV0869a]